MISTAVGDEQQINLAILNADKHSPALNVQNTKQWVDAYVSGSWKLPLAGREVTALMSK